MSDKEIEASFMAGLTWFKDHGGKLADKGLLDLSQMRLKVEARDAEIVRLHTEEKLSQRQIANALGTSRRTVQRKLGGSKEPFTGSNEPADVFERPLEEIVAHDPTLVKALTKAIDRGSGYLPLVEKLPRTPPGAIDIATCDSMIGRLMDQIRERKLLLASLREYNGRNLEE